MRAYIRVLINHVSASLTYRWNILLGIGVQMVQLLTTLFVWRSIFAEQNLVQGYTLAEMTTYLVLTSLLGVTFSSMHIFRLSTMVRKGTLNAYLVRPYSFLGDSFAVFMGSKVVELAITVAAITGFLAMGYIPAGQVSLWSLVLVGSNLLLLFVFGSLLGTLSFWLIEMWPLKPLYNSLMALMGGLLFPLDLLPGIWPKLVGYTPFALFGFVNARALQGALSASEMSQYIVVSFTWSILFLAVYLILWRRGLRKYEGVNA